MKRNFLTLSIFPFEAFLIIFSTMPKSGINTTPSLFWRLRSRSTTASSLAPSPPASTPRSCFLRAALLAGRPAARRPWEDQQRRARGVTQQVCDVMLRARPRALRFGSLRNASLCLPYQWLYHNLANFPFYKGMQAALLILSCYIHDEKQQRLCSHSPEKTRSRI